VRPFVERLITLACKALPLKDAETPALRARYLHYYRTALSRLQDKQMVQKLFGEGRWREGERECLGARFAGRPGGYTRIVRIGGSRLGVPVAGTVSAIPEVTYEMGGEERSLKLIGNRLGDNARQVIFELVEKAGAAADEEMAPTVARAPSEGPAEGAAQSADDAADAPAAGSEEADGGD